MSNVPLHPFVVHLPIALSLLMPFLAGAALLAWYRGWLPGRRLWAAAVALQAVLLIFGVAALRTGEAEEERVEAVVAEAVLERHEEAAKAFVVASAAVLLISAVPLFGRVERARRAALLAIAGMVTVLVLGVRAGKLGGEMVYVEGAAAAYADQRPSTDPAAAHAVAEGEHDDD